MSHTKYIKMKRCLACWQVTDFDLKRCPNCSFLFMGEATPEEALEKTEQYNYLTENSTDDYVIDF